MSPREEHLATRRAAGLFDFSFMGLYEFADIASLQRIQTRNLELLAPGQIAYTLLLNDGGAVLIDATVWRLDAKRCWLFAGRRSGFGGGHDRSGEHVILALQGPLSGVILAKLLGADAVRSLRYFHFLRKGDMVVGRLGFSGELGYELLVPAERGATLRQSLLDQAVPECSFAAADSLRIESGYVLFDREIDGRANPRELGLERLVYERRTSFEMARKLVGMEILERPARKDAPLAQPTSACFSPVFQRSIALCFVPADAATGDSVRFADGRAARVARLPFYDPGRLRPRVFPL